MDEYVKKLIKLSNVKQIKKGTKTIIDQKICCQID